MPNTSYLFIHPLLGKDDRWSGYLAETPEDAPVTDAMIGLVMNDPHWGHFDKRHPWFLPATPGISTNNEPQTEGVVVTFRPIPPEHWHAVQLHETEQALRQAGQPIALRAAPGGKLPATGVWTHLLISMSHARTLPPYALLGLASRTQITALDVHSQLDQTWSHANACQLTSAEFLTARSLQARKADVIRLKLLELLALITRDADTEEIEEVFREQPKLAYSLLRLVNSAASAPRSPVTSFSQAINLLGRRQLQRWLQLLVYADQNDGKHPNPLLQKAASRGRMLELLAQTQAFEKEDKVHFDDMAFMIGTFSMLDALLNLPLNEIVDQLPLPDPVRQSLVGHEGPLGKLLQAIISADARELAMASRQLDRLGISPEKFTAAQLSALHWADHIRSATS